MTTVNSVKMFHSLTEHVSTEVSANISRNSNEGNIDIHILIYLVRRGLLPSQLVL